MRPRALSYPPSCPRNGRWGASAGCPRACAGVSVDALRWGFVQRVPRSACARVRQGAALRGTGRSILPPLIPPAAACSSPIPEAALAWPGSKQAGPAWIRTPRAAALRPQDTAACRTAMPGSGAPRRFPPGISAAEPASPLRGPPGGGSQLTRRPRRQVAAELSGDMGLNDKFRKLEASSKVRRPPPTAHRPAT